MSVGPSVPPAEPPTPEMQAALDRIVAPHLDSFNFAMARGLEAAVDDLPPVYVDLPEGSGPDTGSGAFMTLRLRDATIRPPQTLVHLPSIGATTRGTAELVAQLADTDSRSAHLLWPAECRMRGVSYSANLTATLVYTYYNGMEGSTEINLGNIPVMVRSALCHLSGLSRDDLIKHHEEPSELGGYFVCNGLERLFRLLIMPRRNVPFSIMSFSFSKRGPRYSPYAVRIRCARPDTTTSTVNVHYLTDGTSQVRFVMNKAEYLIPSGLLLRAFVPMSSDREIHTRLMQGDTEDSFLAERAELLIQDANQRPCRSQMECLRYIGERFRQAFRAPRHLTDIAVAQELIKRHIFVHLTKGEDKWELLIVMIRKLFSLVRSKGGELDNQDSPALQEVLLPGHLYLAFLKEKMHKALTSIRFCIVKELVDKQKTSDPITALGEPGVLKKCISRGEIDIGRRLDYMLATGNLISDTGLDLQQVAGLSIVAEKLNWYRYVSHFASIHRGQFFTTMKTTAVRRLLPESWGFLCPVHTPDGSPCGLLNHLASNCHVIANVEPESVVKTVKAKAVALGVVTPMALTEPDPLALPVLLNGMVIGWVPLRLAGSLCDGLRRLKVQGTPGFPNHLEIVPGLPGTSTAFPVIQILTTEARMVRPVISMRHRRIENAENPIEIIGSMEQQWLSIACLPEDVCHSTTHREISPTNLLSVVAMLTPFSDFNQSPRNMYQCQMGKQSMATPLHSYPYRTDSKLYRLYTPQTPLARTRGYDQHAMDEYPIGVNAVVAVISYTGYDMEDAMIIKKGSYERGFMHGAVYKTEKYETMEKRARGAPAASKRFSNEAAGGNPKPVPTLDDDGLPTVGQRLVKGDPIVCMLDDTRGEYHIKKQKSSEMSYVDQIRVHGKSQMESVSLTLRYPRNPIIGDKFSSRHGQKGVLSVLWPEEDMPFSESGISPDVIINPHAFPSRMTIGMLVESMAGKAGAMHGVFQDATPFEFDERNRATDYFGRQLRAAGYNYTGNEPMYSGAYGTEMRADIFVGVVYYQRLRHMVSDKYQVRSEGAMNAVFRQPVKGRKVGGGIRLGEMERDALLAHGSAFALQDRLMHCSDGYQCQVCGKCGSVLAPRVSADGSVVCGVCHVSTHMEAITIPYVFRYLAVELAAMNISVKMDVERH